MSDPLPLVVANHKANKTWDELSSWLGQVAPAADDFRGTVVVCPAIAYISQAGQKIKELKSKLIAGSQNISQFDQGPYTGEVAASQIKDQVRYTIIGHSERRENFNETDQLLSQKVQMAKKANLAPIFCIQDETTKIPNGVEIVAYEPTFAIGTGNPDTPENAKSISAKIKQKGDYIVLYGGSVNAQNVKSFVDQDLISGVLVGSASLEAQSFIGILQSLQ